MKCIHFRTKDNKHDERGLLRQQERIDYSLYMSSSETDDDSDSSLTRMFENVENSSYVKNKDYLNKDRTLRKVHYPDYYYRFGSDSDSDPEFYCRPQPVY